MRIIVTKSDPKKTEEESTSSNTTRYWNSVPNPDQEGEKSQNELKQGSVSIQTTTYGSNPHLKEEEQEDQVSPILKKKKKKRITTSTTNNSKFLDEGYNSSEEYSSVPSSSHSISRDQVINLIRTRNEEFNKFQEELRRTKGFIIKKMAEDGNCLFRAIADQIYGDPEMHDQIRERVMNYMWTERDHFSQYVTEDFSDYVKRKRRNGVYGNNLEIQAIGELFNRPIEIYRFQSNGGGQSQGQVVKQNLFHDTYKTDNPFIRLAYHNANHYNSVIDPNSPSVGVGLGLPNLDPGHADKLQIRSAILQSENLELEQLLVDQTAKQSELDEAQLALEQAILDQSQYEFEEAIIAASRREYLDSLAKNAKKQ